MGAIRVTPPPGMFRFLLRSHAMASRGRQRFNQSEILRELALDDSATAASRLRAIRLIRQSQPKRRRKPDEEVDPAVARGIATVADWLRRPGSVPTAELHRGVPVFACQTEARIRDVVRPGIDRVLDQPATPLQLVAIAADPSQCPEARLLASAIWMARDQIRLEAHDARFSGLAGLQASCAGLDTLSWQDPTVHASLLDTWPADRPPAPRPPELARRLAALQAAA